MNSQLLPATAESWNELVRRCADFDVYHLRAYHEIAAHLGEGEPLLFAYEDAGNTAVFPLVVRTIPNSQYRDATSVYGYPGPLASHQQPNAAFAQAFQTALRTALRERRIVSVFSRAHPLIDCAWLLDGFAERVVHGLTVGVDLTLPEAEQSAQMSQEHRRATRKAVKQGFELERDAEFCELPRFIELYEETMRRNDADKYYFFPPSYYQMLRGLLGDHVHLFHVRYMGRIVASTLIFETNGWLQYHLGGSETGAVPPGCMRFLLEGIRQWGSDAKFRRFHLGGGLGGRKDSLFQFKSGFSKLRFPFETIRIVADADAYAELTRERFPNSRPTDNGFFPAYRAP